MSKIITIKDFIKNQTKYKPKSKVRLFGSLDTKLNLYYYKNFLNDDIADKYFKLFEEKIVWNSQENSKITINNQEIYANRKQTSYGDYDIESNRSWNNDDEISNVLRKLRYKVELFTNNKFNYVLINRYENGEQTIGYHQDKECFGLKGVQVAGVSLGAVRPIYFKPIAEKFIHSKLPNKLSIALENGSLYVMNYPTNENYKHTIPKITGIKTIRISLTFRWLD